MYPRAGRESSGNGAIRHVDNPVTCEKRPDILEVDYGSNEGKYRLEGTRGILSIPKIMHFRLLVRDLKTQINNVVRKRFKVLLSTRFLQGVNRELKDC